MGRFLKKLRDIWAHEELRKRLGITFGFILVYRIGSFIVIPGVDSDALQEQMSALGGGGLGSILSLFTGGAFSRASIFALGIMPYISASINFLRCVLRAVYALASMLVGVTSIGVLSTSASLAHGSQLILFPI